MEKAGEEEVDWFDPSPFIEGSHKLTEVVGFWPSFDDAAVLTLRLDRADGSPWRPESDSPTLDLTLRLSETGYYLVKIQFKNVENIELSNFSYQNEIMEIVFDREPDSVDSEGRFWSAKLLVEIQAHCGLQAKFECKSAAVRSVVPCNKDGSISGISATLNGKAK
jgi:hypothetical protein